MARRQHRAGTQPFPVLGPYMDAGRSPSSLQDGTMSRLAGVDGRHIGSLKPFPGCNRLTFGSGKYRLYDLDNDFSETEAVKGFCEYVIVKRGTSGSNTLSGFLIRTNYDSTVQLMFVYYDTNDSAWHTQAINSGTAVSATADVDVTTYGPFMYITVENDSNYPRTVWHDGSSWQDKAMGPQYTSLNAPKETSSPAGGKLEAGTYGVAYRFYDSSRNLYSAMSSITDVDVDTDDDYIQFDIDFPSGTPNDFDTIQVFRTISVEAAENTFSGSLLYKDNEVSMAASWSAGDYQAHDDWLTAGETLTDEVLVQQSTYDPWEDTVGDPPEAATIEFYNGTIFMGTDEDETGANAGFRWSGLGMFNPEVFSGSHLFRGKLQDGKVLKLVQSGEILWALTKSCIYRIRKVGVQLSVHRFHVGRGVVGKCAAHPVGDDLMLMTPLGLAALNGASGEMQLFSQVDNVVHSDWAGDLDDYIVSAYDSYMGASFFVNTDDDEGVVLWHTTKAATLLKALENVDEMTTGPHPEDGGAPRAFFVSSAGLFSYPDDDLSGSRTMDGVTYRKYGTATGGSTTTLEDSGSGFATSCIRTYVYMLTGDNAGESRQITARTDTELTFSPAMSNAVSSGDIYAISRIPFELVAPPLKSGTIDRPDFERRVLKAIGIYSIGHTGISSNPTAFWTVGAYRQGESTLAASNTVDMADGAAHQQPDSSAPGSVAGFLVEPSISFDGCGVGFELTALEFVHTIGKGRSE